MLVERASYVTWRRMSYVVSYDSFLNYDRSVRVHVLTLDWVLEKFSNTEPAATDITV